jgi:transglutaminase-like putative cysteine protease
MKHRLLLLLLCAAAARADHPPEWLRLPAPGDPVPKGVSSWILTQEERVTQESADTVRYHYRTAIMVFSEAGAKGAGYSLPFTAGAASVVSSKAWAMSPDGRKCREFGGNEFVIASSTVSNWMWDLSKVVFFEADKFLEPGWVVAYEVEIKSTSTPFDIVWSPRERVPVRYASLQLVPMAGGSVKWKAFSGDMPDPSPLAGSPGLAWTVSNVPPYGQDVPEGMEPNSLEMRAYLLTSATESKSWADVVRLARAQMDPQAVLTPDLQDLAKGKVGKGGLWARIEPVCRFVQKEVTYLGITIDTDSMAGYRPHAAADVCDNRYGDCKDKATLLCTLLRAVGVDARIVLVSSGYPRVNRTDWPSAYFNHAIVAIPCSEPAPQGATVVRLGGTDYLLFDPTNDEVPFGLLPMEDMGGEALVLAQGVASTVTIPPFPSGDVTVESQVKTVLNADGSAQIDLSEERFGIEAAEASAADDTVPLHERTGKLERRIQRRVPLISDLLWESKDDKEAHTWTRTAHFSAQFVGKRLTGGMYVSNDLMSALPSPKPWDDKTDGWVTITPGTLKREIELDPPAGWEFYELPADWSLKSPAGEGSMRFWQEAGVAKGEVIVRIEGGILDRPGYLGLRDLVGAAVAAERRPIVLRRIKAAAAQPPAPPAAAAPAAH